jgi:tetratricopeptide (TPR) repeat protein
MASRLLDKKPKDFQILIGQAGIYLQSRNLSSRKHGYDLIQQLIKMYPSRPKVYFMLGTWYYEEYMFEHHPSDYNQAMSTYQKALAMYPAHSLWWNKIADLMAFLTMRYHQISGS